MPNTTATTTSATPAEPTAPPDDAADPTTTPDEQTQPRRLLPAEHLERNDDMCSSILMDQIACDALPLGRLGVRHQQAAFERPSIEPADVLKSIRRVILGGRVPETVREIVDKVPALREHIESKPDKKHRDEAISHIGMYLDVYRPTSRVEIWRTDRYAKAEGFHELGVFATSVIPQGEILYEIQGQCADLPEEWSNSDEDTDSDDTSSSDRDGTEDGPARVRRCVIQGRRDFSIISSTRYAKTQLFLGPARFINHDCEPNVELMSLQKNRVSYRTRRRIMIGEELTTIYAPHYFRKNNRGCMCLTCEMTGKGYYEKHPTALSMRTAAPSLQEESSRPTEPPGSGSDWDGDSNASDGDSTTAPATPPSSADDESIDDSAADSAAVNRPFRQVRNNTRKLDFSKKWNSWSPSDNYLPRRPPVDDPDAKRCHTCIDLLPDDGNPIPGERGWDNYCGRCIRHALIFKRPWPARTKEQVSDFPPINLVPINYRPKIISLAVLPSVDPPPEPEPEPVAAVEAPDYVRNPNKFDRAWWKLKAQWAAEDEEVQRLREEDWAQQCVEEERARQAAEHRAEAKRLRELEKAKRNKNKIKGSGLWAKYEVVPDDVMLRRIAERNTVVTGTRSGRRFAAQDDNEAEILREAQKTLDRERFRDVRDWEKNRRLRIRQQVQGDVEEDEEEEAADEGQVEMEVEEQPQVNAIAGPSRQNAVAGPSRGRHASSSVSVRASSSPHLATRATPTAPVRASSRSVVTPRSGPARTPQLTSSARSRLLQQNGTKESPYEIPTSSDDDLRPRRPVSDKFSDKRHMIIDLAGSSSSEDDGSQRLPKPLKFIPNPRYSATTRRPEEDPAAPPVKRGPGRPRGTGPKQIRERRRAERERARLEKEKEQSAQAERQASSSRKQDGDNGVALSSADEASPPSIRPDDPDSDTHLSLDEEILFAGPAEFTSSPSESDSSESSLSPSPPRSLKRKRPSGNDGPPRPRHFFRLDGIRLARVSPDRSRPPPAVFTGPT